MKAPPEPPGPPPHIDVRIHSPLWKAQPSAERTVRDAILAAAALSTAGGEVSIVLTDDSAIRSLNRDWRGIDRPTNVLSFPAVAAQGAPQEGPRALGDIVLALETVEREAQEQQLRLAHHFQHLVVHGLLHLLGFDHETEADAAIMEGLEIEILAGLNPGDRVILSDMSPWSENERVRLR